jgi:hypothetical protein
VKGSASFELTLFVFVLVARDDHAAADRVLEPVRLGHVSGLVSQKLASDRVPAHMYLGGRATCVNKADHLNNLRCPAPSGNLPVVTTGTHEGGW